LLDVIFGRSELIGRSRFSPSTPPSALTLPITPPMTANSHKKGDLVRSYDAVERHPNLEFGLNPPRYSSLARTRLASLPTSTKTKLNETKPNETKPNPAPTLPDPTRPYPSRTSSRNPLKFGASIVECVLYAGPKAQVASATCTLSPEQIVATSSRSSQ